MAQNRTDIVIMGAGLAGLAAAVSARTKGAEVTVLESRKGPGGISVTGMGIFAVESHMQNERNLDFTKDDAFRLIMEKTAGKADPLLVRNYVDNTASTIDWLEEMGVEFVLSDKLTFPGAHNMTGHLVNSPKRGVGATASAHMVQMVQKRAEESGARIISQAAVTDIEKKEKGYLVSYRNTDTDEISVIEAKAVIISAGGCVHDNQLMAEIGSGFEFGRNAGTVNNVPLTGDGIRLARKLGAAPEEISLMFTTFCDALKFPRNAKTQPLWDLMMFSFPYLWVNGEGKRFVDEGAMDGAFMANTVARQRDGEYYIILDEGIRQKIMKEGPAINGYLASDLKLDIKELFDLVKEAGSDNFYTADSVESLAEQLGLPEEQLKATIRKYNEDCAKGHDSIFCKNRKYLTPIEGPVYYAVRRKNAAYGTVGGIRIDEKMQAVDRDMKVIPGLYAAGDCANNIVTYNTTLMYDLWGCCLGFAAVSGKLSGEYAADYIARGK